MRIQTKTKNTNKKKQKKRNDMFVYGILLHWALMSHFEVCLLGIFVIVGSCEIFMSFHSLSHSCYAFGVLGIHMRVLWYSMLIGSWLLCIRYERWVIFFTKVSGSLSNSSFHHWWYDFPLLYQHGLIIHCLSLPSFVSHYLFPDIHSTFFIHSLHINTHFWFDTFFTSFTCFIDGLTTHPFSHFAIDISFGYL